MVGGEGRPLPRHRPEDLLLTEAQGRGTLQAGDPARPPRRARAPGAGAEAQSARPGLAGRPGSKDVPTVRRQLRSRLSPGPPRVPWFPGLQQVWGGEGHCSGRHTSWQIWLLRRRSPGAR